MDNLLYFAGAVFCCGAIGWILFTTINYGITSKFLTVYCLGIPVRRFALKDMTSISKRRRYRAEFWINTLGLKHRKLIIRRDRGIFKEIVITPRYRYAFRKQLEDAVSAVRKAPLVSDPIEDE